MIFLLLSFSSNETSCSFLQIVFFSIINLRATLNFPGHQGLVGSARICLLSTKNSLLIVEKWLTLSVLANNRLAMTEVDVLAKESGNTDCQAEEQENGSNRCRKFPLKGDNMCSELRQCKSCLQSVRQGDKRSL